MQRFDIRVYKQNLRSRFMAVRHAMPLEAKHESDQHILERLCATWEYKSADMLVTYVSTQLEVDTKNLILRALSENKRVAVPYCIENSREMRFYFIRSLDELQKRTFGVLEPVAEVCSPVEDFTGSICIVPGLAFDRQGYRLGYGKGYYDRFLADYRGTTIGICYKACMTHLLHRGRYDIACDMVVTENELVFCRKNRR